MIRCCIYTLFLTTTPSLLEAASVLQGKAFLSASLPVSRQESISSSCRAKLSKQSACPLADDFLQEVQTLRETSLTSSQKAQADPEFQALVADLQATEPVLSSHLKGEHEKLSDTPKSLSAGVHSQDDPPDDHPHGDHLQGELYIFVSFSMGEKALMNLAEEVKRTQASLVLRGFRHGSYLKTAKALQKIITKTGVGFSIDPELFTLFNVSSVPTYVLSLPFPLSATDRVQTPLHDRLMGHVSIRFALETFAAEGDLKAKAKALLKQGDTQ